VHRTPSSQLMMSTSTMLPTKPVVDYSDKHDLAASALSWRWIQSQRSLTDSIRKLSSHPEQTAAHNRIQCHHRNCYNDPGKKPVVDASDKPDLATSALSWRWIQSQRSLANSIRKLIYHPEQMAAPSTILRVSSEVQVLPRWHQGGTVLRVFHRCYETHLNSHLRQEEVLNRSRATDVTSSHRFDVDNRFFSVTHRTSFCMLPLHAELVRC